MTNYNFFDGDKYFTYIEHIFDKRWFDDLF